LIPPNQFIPQMEKTELIGPLTEYVIDTALDALPALCRINPEITISINISPNNLEDLSMPDRILAKLARHAVLPQQLVIEVTETVICGDIKCYLDILTRLRMKGFNLSIDDFGTGYSSLEMLTKAPFNELKIDQCFTQKICTNAECRAVVSTSILLARELGMRVVAEGIETEEVFKELANLGCHTGQGYWMAKPLPMDEFLEWSETWSRKFHVSFSGCSNDDHLSSCHSTYSLQH